MRLWRRSIFSVRDWRNRLLVGWGLTMLVVTVEDWGELLLNGLGPMLSKDDRSFLLQAPTLLLFVLLIQVLVLNARLAGWLVRRLNPKRSVWWGRLWGIFCGIVVFPALSWATMVFFCWKRRRWFSCGCGVAACCILGRVCWLGAECRPLLEALADVALLGLLVGAPLGHRARGWAVAIFCLGSLSPLAVPTLAKLAEIQCARTEKRLLAELERPVSREWVIAREKNGVPIDAPEVLRLRELNREAAFDFWDCEHDADPTGRARVLRENFRKYAAELAVLDRWTAADTFIFRHNYGNRMLVDWGDAGEWQLIRAVARYYRNRAIVAGIGGDRETVRDSLMRLERWNGYWYQAGPDLIYHMLGGVGDVVALGALSRLLPNPAWSDADLLWFQEYAVRLSVRAEAALAYAQEELVSVTLDARNYLDRSRMYPDPEEKSGFRELSALKGCQLKRYLTRFLDGVDSWLMFHQQLNTLRMFRASPPEREALKRRLATVQRRVPACFFWTSRYGYLEVWVERTEAIAATGRAAVIGVAIERFRRKYGKKPTAVSALVPEFLPQIPPGLNGRAFEISFAPWQVRADGKDFCVSGYRIQVPGPGKFRVKVMVMEKQEARR